MLNEAALLWTAIVYILPNKSWDFLWCQQPCHRCVQPARCLENIFNSVWTNVSMLGTCSSSLLKSKVMGQEEIPCHCWAILCTEAKHPAQLPADFGPGAVCMSSKHLLTSFDSEEPLMRGVRSFPQGLQTPGSQHLDFVHKIEMFLKTCCWSA